MKSIKIFITIFVLLLTVSCTVNNDTNDLNNNTSKSTNQITSITENSVIGTYLLDTRSDWNDLTYNITYQKITINEDKTYNYSHEWVSKTMGQTYGAEDIGTWTIEGKTIVCTNDNDFVTVYEVSGDIITNTSKQGVVTTYKKE